MPRGRGRPSKSSSGGEGTKTKGRPTKRDSKVDDEDNQVVDLENGSDNDADGQETGGEVDTGELPVAPASVQAVKKVVIAPKDIRSSGWENVKEVYLKHPRTGTKSLFFVCTNSTDNNSSNDFKLFEVLTMQHETRSWFLNNSVVSDGNLYVCTPMDPLFLVVQTLAKTTKTKPLCDHLSESSLPAVLVDVFSKCLSYKQLENISVRKESDDIVAFAYSEEKTLSWLTAKTDKVAKYFTEKGITHTESSVSSNFVKSSVGSASKEDYLRYACEIIGEYVDDNLKLKLFEKFGLSFLPEKNGLKRKNDQAEDNAENESVNKKAKVTEGDIVPLEDYGSKTNGTPLNKTTKTTARAKEFQKAAQGSHSLLKFFSAKSK